MIVTTAITAVTPTMMPTSVSAVRSLFWRRLASATKNASQTAAILSRGNERSRAERFVGRRANPFGGFVADALRGNIAPLSNLFVFFDQAVSNRDDAMRPSRYVVLVRDENDGVAFFVKLLEEVHDVVTRRRVQRSGRFIREENRRMIHQRASDRDALTLAA